MLLMDTVTGENGVGFTAVLVLCLLSPHHREARAALKSTKHVSDSSLLQRSLFLNITTTFISLSSSPSADDSWLVAITRRAHQHDSHSKPDPTLHLLQCRKILAALKPLQVSSVRSATAMNGLPSVFSSKGDSLTYVPIVRKTSMRLLLRL